VFADIIRRQDELLARAVEANTLALRLIDEQRAQIAEWRRRALDAERGREA